MDEELGEAAVAVAPHHMEPFAAERLDQRSEQREESAGFGAAARLQEGEGLVVGVAVG